MAAQKSDSPEPVAAAKPAVPVPSVSDGSEVKGPVPAARSEALEVELAMLEAMLPPEAERTPRPTRVDSPKDSGDPR
jgi:hypothetical protein